MLKFSATEALKGLVVDFKMAVDPRNLCVYMKNGTAHAGLHLGKLCGLI